MFGRKPKYDLVIAGSGSGALTAAIAAHDAGLKPIILEKSDRIGGGTAYSGGVVWAPCNHMMQRKRIVDSVEQAMQYLALASAGRGDEVLQQRYVENVGRIIAQVEQWTGIKWIIWPGQPDYYPDLPGACQDGRAILQHPLAAHEVLEAAEQRLPGMQVVRLTPHMDLVPGFQTANRPARESWVAGRAIIGGLWKAVLERGIEYHVSTSVCGLLVEHNRVVGIRFERKDGSSGELRASRGVLLNTGGFDWNDTMARRHLPGPKTWPQTPPSNTGDGHALAAGLGAAVALMDKAVLHPAIHIPGEEHDGKPLYRMFNAELSKPHSVLVNNKGHRFVSETAYFAVSDSWNQVDPRYRTYTNVPSYLIVDSQYRRKYGLPGVHPGAPMPNWMPHANTLADLAGLLGVDALGLENEIAIFNRDCDSGVDTRFDRGASAYERFWGDADHDGQNPTMGSLAEPPFFAVQVHPSHAGTRGGVLTSPNAEVLRMDGSVIEGLFACGNTAANLLFGAGYGSGSAVGSSMVFGYLAAEFMARR